MATPLLRRTAVGAALALLIGLYQLSVAGVTRSQAPALPALRDLSSIAQLQAAFDADREKVRVLLLLSPT
jgi:hypothetical protein